MFAAMTYSSCDKKRVPHNISEYVNSELGVYHVKISISRSVLMQDSGSRQTFGGLESYLSEIEIMRL